MKEFMVKFTNCRDRASIEKAYAEACAACKTKEDRDELWSILDCQMWKAWEDKTLDNSIPYLYNRLRDSI